MLTVTPPDLHVHVEAGYTANGTVKVNTTYSDGPDPSTLLPPQVVRQDVTGDNLIDINGSGQALALTTPDSMMAAPVMNLVGSTLNADITAGVLVDMNGTLAWSGYVGGSAPTLSRGLTPTAITPAAAFARADRGISASTVHHGAPVVVRSIRPGVVVVEDVPPALVSGDVRPSGNSGEGTNKSEKHVRTFLKDKTKWVLSEDRSESDDEDALGKRHSESIASYGSVRWFSNVAKDSARHAARATSQWIPRPAAPGASTVGDRAPALGALMTNAIPVPASPRRMEACDDMCGGAGRSGGGAGPPPLGTAPPCFEDVSATVNVTGASLNVLYQHGFNCTAKTWCKMSEFVRARFLVGYELRQSLAWRSSYEDQALELGSRFATDVASRPGSYVFIGHSNGGLVSRYAAQNMTDASLVRGVISISSPTPAPIWPIIRNTFSSRPYPYRSSARISAAT